MRFSLAREAGLTEEWADRIDDGFAGADLPEGWKTALALTDHLILTPGPLPAALAAELDAAFAADEQTELLLGIALFHGFSKMLIALGLEPEAMATTIMPTPSPSGMTVDPVDGADPHVALLESRPELAQRWAAMARALVDVAPTRAPSIDAARRRLAQLIGVSWAVDARVNDNDPSDTTNSATGDDLDRIAVELAELFAIDVRAITEEHRELLKCTTDEAGVIQMVMALAVYDGIYRLAAAVVRS